MKIKEILVIVALIVLLGMIRKSTYQTGGGGLMCRPMPKVEYINPPYPPLFSADVRDPPTVLVPSSSIQIA